MDIKAVPKASPTPLPEVAAYLQPFCGVFRRRLSRQSCERYITGLLTDLPRKNCDTMAAALAGTTTERLQYLLTDAAWDPLALDELRVQRMLAVSPGGGILALDDTGLPKQGHTSVGVAQQYCGTLGKVANCQSVVTAEYIADAPTTSTPFHWPVTAQLYLPESWSTDQARRKQARVPDDIPAQTKLDIALQLIDRARQWGVPFALVLADAGYGRNSDFLKGLEERNLLYCCAVECTFGVRRPEEVARLQQTPPPATAGRKGRPRKAHPAPLYSAQAIIGTLPDDQWQTVSWREGSHGTMRKQFVAVRMRWGVGCAARTLDDCRVHTGAEGWLIGERPVSGEEDEIKYYFSNLPASISFQDLVALVRGRWPIEQFYEDAKQECGLDEYQGRRWEGLHRHVALVMLAYCFLMLQRLCPQEGVSGQVGAAHPRPSLPSLHRTIVVWLLQDLVLWWIATDQIQAFRPRRN